MNKEHQFLSEQNERWQRRNLSRLMALAVIVLSLLVLAGKGFGQQGGQDKAPPTLISWRPAVDCAEPSPTDEKPACDSIISDGAAVRSISYKGTFLAVSFVDNGRYVVADVFVTNDSGERMLVDPRHWVIAHYNSEQDFLDRKTPLAKGPAIDPSDVAQKIVSRIRWANALSAAGAGMQTQTGTVTTNTGASGTVTMPGSVLILWC